MFSPFERLVALRYLRARRSEGFISVIAGFSLAGIALGVATLIIVMSVMNGFRDELMGRILGLNGHLDVRSVQGPLEDYDSLIDRLKQLSLSRTLPVAMKLVVTMLDRRIRIRPNNVPRMATHGTATAIRV